MTPSSSAREDVERSVSVLVKTFERPACLARLLASIRRYYPRIRVLVVDDSAKPLEPILSSIDRYWHFPYNTLGKPAAINFGLSQVETDYVVVCDDDQVFVRRTDLAKMLHVLRSTPFDLVSCRMIDHAPGRRGIGFVNRFEGTLELLDGVLVESFGADRGALAGFPVYDFVLQFYMADRARLGVDPLDPRLKIGPEHLDLFLSLKQRGVLSTALSDVSVHHYPERPTDYGRVRNEVEAYERLCYEKWGITTRVAVGRRFGWRYRMAQQGVIRGAASATHELVARTVATAGRRLRGAKGAA